MRPQADLLRDQLRNLIDQFDPDFADEDLVRYAETLFDTTGNILTHDYNHGD